MRGAVVLGFVILMTAVSSCAAAGETPLADLKNVTTTVSLNEFVKMSEEVYSQIAALNETTAAAAAAVDAIETDLLVEEFRRLKVDLSENQSGREITNATEEVMVEINSTLFSKVEELKKTRTKLDYQRFFLDAKCDNVSKNRSLVENYTAALTNRSSLESLYNESASVLRRKIMLSVSIPLLSGAILGAAVYHKLRRREDFMSLFTQVKSRALMYAVIASIAVSVLSLYVLLECWLCYS
jgi:hypothetical protein